MPNKIPRSPFTTRLSGSAKETELRLRNIFQWKKKRPPVILFLLTVVVLFSCFGLVSCESTVAEPPAEEPVQENESPVLPTGEVAVPDGQAFSPNGKYEVRLSGAVEGITSGGLVPAEYVQVVDTTTDEVLWESSGAYEHAVVWSPESTHLALARTSRTYCTVAVIDTETWASWDVTLPDGSAIPEYTFLPDDWCEWLDERTFLLTVGRDLTTQNTYYCAISPSSRDLMVGDSLDCTVQTLSTEHDFDHDGSPETVTLMTTQLNSGAVGGWCEVQIKSRDGAVLWREHAFASHAGWNSLFVCTLDGRDYLLRYHPTMYQGICNYSYTLFSLNAEGETKEIVRQSNDIEFNTNFSGMSMISIDFDAIAVADFMDEINELLSHSKLLFTTDEELKNIDPIQPYHNPTWLCSDYSHWGYAYDHNKTMRENLQAFEKTLNTN